MNRYRKIFIIFVSAGLLLATFLAQASIILNAVVVNPSKDKKQKATLKAYLPEEITPEDIVDAEDLEISYDIDKSVYYVYKEVELEPGEAVKKQIELKDVWVISEKELNSNIKKAKELTKGLKGTKHYDRAEAITDMIENHVERILTKQNKEMDSLPEIHIAAYRGNMELFNKIKEELLPELEKMNMEIKPATQVPVDKIFIKASWWIILGVVSFLGLLSLVLFFIWHKQAAEAKSKQKAKESSQEEES
jgi:hypothetical protein